MRRLGVVLLLAVCVGLGSACPGSGNSSGTGQGSGGDGKNSGGGPVLPGTPEDLGLGKGNTSGGSQNQALAQGQAQTQPQRSTSAQGQAAGTSETPAPGQGSATPSDGASGQARPAVVKGKDPVPENRTGEFYRDLAQVYLKHHFFPEAAELYAKAVELADDLAEKCRFRQDMAQALREAGRSQEALTVLEVVVAQSADQVQKVRAQYLLGQVCEDLGDVERATAAYKYVAQYADKEYERKQAQRQLTALLARSEDLDAEVARLKKNVEDHPDDLAATRILADLLRQQNRSVEAVPLFEKLRTAQPQDRDILQAMADLYRTVGRHREAIALYEDMSQRFPAERSYCLERIAFVYASWGKKDKAAEFAQRIVDEAGGNLGAYIRAAHRFIEIGYYVKAAEVLDRAVEMAGNPPEKEELQFQLAQVYMQDGKLKDAVVEYRSILEGTTDPRNRQRAEQFLRSSEAKLKVWEEKQEPGPSVGEGVAVPSAPSKSGNRESEREPQVPVPEQPAPVESTPPGDD